MKPITRTVYKSPNKSWKNWFNRVKAIKITIVSLLVIFLIGLVYWLIWFQKNITGDLPKIESLDNLNLSQTTVITDRNGEILYRYFDQNREYVEFDKINENMINAIVALEDQRFWEHDGIDYWGLVRAALNNVVSDNLQWASTINQQLVKNLFLTNEKSYVRKLKEVVLVKKVDELIKEEIDNKYSNLSSWEIRVKNKEKLLEVYLNYLDFGNSSYWVEAASKLYFDKSASDLNVLESAILASVLKSASQYNPYTKKDNLVWKLKFVDSEWNEYVGTGDITSTMVSKIKWNLENETFGSYDNFINTVKEVSKSKIIFEGTEYDVTYVPGRKDVAIYRMYEDKHITEDELKQAFVLWLDLEFARGGFDIKAPHFVFRVIEELEKQYDSDFLKHGGLEIRTTLDLEVQKMAEQAITDNYEDVKYYGWNNNAMVYINSQNGDVLWYVWSVDYFNEEIWGQNDMIQAKRQVWSTMKPFVYAKWLETLPVTLSTPIYDIPFSLWGFTPNNADGTFMGIMALKNALAYSRNIPAVKMFFAAWWEDVIKPFVKELWMTSVIDSNDYWYSLALWGAEIPMIELANAYMHLSASGKPGEINPILEIKNSDWSVLYTKEEKFQDRVINEWIAYLIWSVISDYANMPPNWVGNFSVRWLNLAIKSWTTNMQTSKWSRARDWWLVSYSPEYVTIFWAGNTDGAALYRNAYGWFMNSDPMKQFWGELLTKWYVENSSMSQIWVSSDAISKISWKLVGTATPSWFGVSDIWYDKRPDNTIDSWLTTFEYDAECNGQLSPFTLNGDIKQWYIVVPETFMPDWLDLANIEEWRRWSTDKSLVPDYLTGKVSFNYDNMFVEYPREFCNDNPVNIDETVVVNITTPVDWGNITSKSSIIYSVKSDVPIRTASVMLNDKVLTNKQYYWSETDITDIYAFDLWEITGTHNLVVMAIDKDWKANQSSAKITIVEEDETAPEISHITVLNKADGTFGVIIVLKDDLSSIPHGNVYYNDKIISDLNNNTITFTIDKRDKVVLKVQDSFENRLEQEIDLSEY